MKTYFFLTCGVFGFLAAGCGKNCIEPYSTQYIFELPVSLIPAQDTFHVGDTITIESVFSDQVLERNLQRRLPLLDWKFHPSTSIYKIDHNPAKDGLPFFDVLLAEAPNYQLLQYSAGTYGLSGQYEYREGKYFLKFKLIPQTSGVYFMEQSSSLTLLNEWQEFPGRCKKTSSDAFANMNEDADNNIHYLSLSPDPHYNTWILIKPELRFHKFGGYCFVVVE
ncbi:MAG: hypothetical protein SGI94_01005 [Saprospiraceae bacterium]|nr:hypothetical protein [Saprospiraceae bacterium]